MCLIGSGTRMAKCLAIQSSWHGSGTFAVTSLINRVKVTFGTILGFAYVVCAITRLSLLQVLVTVQITGEYCFKNVGKGYFLVQTFLTGMYSLTEKRSSKTTILEDVVIILGWYHTAAIAEHFFIWVKVRLLRQNDFSAIVVLAWP